MKITNTKLERVGEITNPEPYNPPTCISYQQLSVGLVKRPSCLFSNLTTLVHTRYREPPTYGIDQKKGCLYLVSACLTSEYTVSLFFLPFEKPAVANKVKFVMAVATVYKVYLLDLWPVQYSLFLNAHYSITPPLNVSK